MKVLLTLLSVLFSVHVNAQNLTGSNAIFPKGNKASNEFFTGNVWVNVLAPADSVFNTQIGSVTFEAGARTHWHRHGGGQMLLVTDGTGYYQEKGKLANAYPNTPLLLHHWGSVDAPDFPPFNGDPQRLLSHVVNPERVHILAPGEPFTLKRLKKY